MQRFACEEEEMDGRVSAYLMKVWLFYECWTWYPRKCLHCLEEYGFGFDVPSLSLHDLVNITFYSSNHRL
jgi:hypothetical protein